MRSRLRSSGRSTSSDDHLQAALHRRRRDLGAVDGQLAVGGGVDAPPQPSIASDSSPGSGYCAGALEDEVLQEVRQAGVRRVLVARADAHEQAHRHRAGRSACGW